MCAGFNFGSVVGALAIIGLGYSIYKLFQCWKKYCGDNIAHAVHQPQSHRNISVGISEQRTMEEPTNSTQLSGFGSDTVFLNETKLEMNPPRKMLLPEAIEGPSLTSDMLHQLSKHLTKRDLQKLCICGLGISEHVVNSVKYNYLHEGTRTIAIELLNLWRKQQVNEQMAHRILCNALDSVRMSFYKVHLRNITSIRLLPPSQIAQLASVIPRSEMFMIGEGYLNIMPETIGNFRIAHSEDSEGFNRAVIRHWAMRNPGVDQNLILASLLYNAKKDGIRLNTARVSDILGVTEGQILDESVSSAAVTSSMSGTTHQTTVTVSGDHGQSGGTSSSRPSLTANMIFKLSQRITTKNDIKRLGISGLKMEEFEVGKFIEKNVDGGITPAADEMLNAWRVAVGDDEEAYERLWRALGSEDVRMALWRQALNVD